MGTWEPGQPGVLVLPSGRSVRGGGLGQALPAGPKPDFGVYLLRRQPPPMQWPSHWLRWPDFGLPADPQEVRRVLREVWERASAQRVEIACGGGRGRTGTALALLAVLDEVPPWEAVDFVRKHYDPKAVEMPWQRRYVQRYRW